MSIGLIVLVGILISPILSNKENKKYSIFEYFLQIPIKKLEVYILNCAKIKLIDPGTQIPFHNN